MKDQCQKGCFALIELASAKHKDGYQAWKDLARIRYFILNTICNDCIGASEHGGAEAFVQYWCQELGVDYLPPIAE